METQIINSIGCLLGIISPAALLYVFSKGIHYVGWEESRKKAYWKNLLFGVIGWTGIVFGLTLGGVFEYVEGDILPRFLVGLIIPVSIMILVQFRSSFNELLDKIPLYALVGAQFFRMFGAVFFLVATTGMGPLSFMSSGYGDVLTGLVAVGVSVLLYRRMSNSKLGVWLFTIIGMLDLLNVSFILLSNYPIWSHANPSTASAGAFPLMLIVGITAPVALLLHIYTIRALLKRK